MVVIDRYSSSQFNVLPNIKGRVLYDTTNNVIRFNNNTDFSNILLYKDETGNVTGINNFTVANSLFEWSVLNVHAKCGYNYFKKGIKRVV
jgi:hypothetical protein